jgi:acyl-CoA synthetase (AMP-forming)/AMP-acid ligase II
MNLQLILDMAADGYGDRVMLGVRHGGVTAEDLRQQANAAAVAVRQSGADAVIYLAANGPAFPIALFGAALAGVPLVPINYRLGESQLDALLANHTNAFGIADAGAAAGALVRAGITSRTPPAFRAALRGATDDERTATEPSAPAVLIYTSGTTSTPKGVVLTHQNLVSYVLGTVEFGSAAPDDASLVSVPPYHIAAVANVLSNLYAGRRTVTLEQFTPEQWLTAVNREGITNALVVPTMLKRILDVLGGEALPSLRSLAYGGAPMPSKTVERALLALPHVDFVNAYGLTETSSTIAILSPDDHREALASDDLSVRARLGSVGRVVPSVELRIRDGSGVALAAGQVGRIWVRGGQVSAEYAGTDTALDHDGFFDTRDDGHLDEDGYLFVAGRADDTIIRGAENIAPAEIEDVLLRHPAVADVVVLGVPDEEWGQRVEAAVVLADHQRITSAELKAHVRERLRSSKTPDEIVFWTELPRTETGKLIRRHALDRLLRERMLDRAL